MNPHIEQTLKALEMFKDWSNYLLVTTVAALGWVATSDQPKISRKALRWTIGALGASTVFGIFTLALIPLVAEAITHETPSFYGVVPRFNLLWMVLAGGIIIGATWQGTSRSDYADRLTFIRPQPISDGQSTCCPRG